jgi:hypothetical protein
VVVKCKFITGKPKGHTMWQQPEVLKLAVTHHVEVWQHGVLRVGGDIFVRRS